jgi:hypothetical protein
MSLVTYPNSKTPKLFGRSSPTIAGRVRKAFAAFGRLVVNVFDAIAEARVPAPTESGVTNRSVCHAANPGNNTRYNADD